MGRKLPDIIMGEYWGVRVVIEGKVNDSSTIYQALFKKCNERIEDGICSIAIGVIYPAELRYIDWTQLEQSIRRSSLKVGVFTESIKDYWINSNFHGLSAIIRRAYESLVSDDVVNTAVEELNYSIDFATSCLANSSGTQNRLKELLLSPKRGED